MTNNLFKSVAIFLFCISLSNIAAAQSKLDSLLALLNSHFEANGGNEYYTKSRGGIQIFQDTTIVAFNNIIPFTCKVKYVLFYDKDKKVNMHTVNFQCLNEQKCISQPEPAMRINEIGFFLKSKEACERFIELVLQIKKEIKLSNAH